MTPGSILATSKETNNDRSGHRSRSIHRRPSRRSRDAQEARDSGAFTRKSLSLLIAAVAFVATAVAALIAFRFTSAPIAGHGSAGQFAAIASAVTALLVFVVGRYVVHVRGGKRRLHLLDYVDIVALAFAHSVIALLGWTVLVVVLADGFQGAVVFAIPVLILTGAAAALTAYLVFHSAVNMNLQLLAVVLASFMVLGVIAEHADRERSALVARQSQRAGHDDQRLGHRVQPHDYRRESSSRRWRAMPPAVCRARIRAALNGFAEAWCSWVFSSASSASFRSTSSGCCTPALPRAWSQCSRF